MQTSEPSVDGAGERSPAETPAEGLPTDAAVAPAAARGPDGRSRLGVSSWKRHPDYRLRGLEFGAESEHVARAVEPPARRPLRSPNLRRKRRRRLVAEFALVIIVAMLAATLVRASVVQSFSVPSAAMVPTLQSGDRILVVKARLLSGPITRGDIVVFRRPSRLHCNTGGKDVQDVVQRVVGLPGETIWSAGATIYIDGQPLAEAGWYSKSSGPIGSMPIRRTQIPAGGYFVMGDNRSNTCDSRLFGTIPASSIVGTVVAVVLRNGHLDIHFF